MIRFKENETHAHAYLICRFDQCFLIDPSHDIEAIHAQINDRKLMGILLTHAVNSKRKFMFTSMINTFYLKINIMGMHRKVIPISVRI